MAVHSLCIRRYSHNNFGNKSLEFQKKIKGIINGSTCTCILDEILINCAYTSG